MKNRTIFLLIAVVAMSTSTFSQTKKITSNELWTASSMRTKMMWARDRRIVTLTENYQDGEIVSSFTSTEDRVLPDKYRLLTISKKDGKESNIEIITIGDDVYKRNNDGEWQSFKLSREVIESSGSGRSILSQITEESDFLNGLAVSKFRELRISSKESALEFEDEVLWFDLQGLYLKTESTKGLLDPRVITSHSVTTYEYDPNIKIEEPIK